MKRRGRGGGKKKKKKIRKENSISACGGEISIRRRGGGGGGYDYTILSYPTPSCSHPDDGWLGCLLARCCLLCPVVLVVVLYPASHQFPYLSVCLSVSRRSSQSAKSTSFIPSLIHSEGDKEPATHTRRSRHNGSGNIAELVNPRGDIPGGRLCLLLVRRLHRGGGLCDIGSKERDVTKRGKAERQKGDHAERGTGRKGINERGRGLD